jgi:hypothetical protein
MGLARGCPPGAGPRLAVACSARVPGRALNTRWASTGSYPPWLHGLHLSRRHPASTRPLSMPYSADRLDRVARARRLVLAAPRDRGRDHPLVDDDRRERHHGGARGGARRRAGLRALTVDPVELIPPSSRCSGGGASAQPALAISSPATRPRPEALALGQLARRGRATTTTSWPGLSSASRCANASRSSRLTRLRSTAPPTLRDTDSPSRGRRRDAFGNVYSTRWRLAVERPCR